MSKRACCRDPQKCGHYIKRRRYVDRYFDEYTEEYMACSQAGLHELIFGGPERCKCPYEKGEHK
jgi:hypothetical protein